MADENDKVIFLQSERTAKGKQKAYNFGNGYIDRGTLSGGKLRAYRCDKDRSKQCTARIHVNKDGYVVNRINDHTHPPDPTYIKRVQVCNNIKFLFMVRDAIFIPRGFGVLGSVVFLLIFKLAIRLPDERSF